jgi:small subunit ribosomal protein S17
MSKTETHKRKLQGIIVSDKMSKTRVVAVTRIKKHPKYQKFYKVTKKYKAHDEENKFVVGTEVIIEETRPISKEKRWRIIGAISKKNNGDI